MEEPESFHFSTIQTDQLVKEMEALRDAAVRLSLTMQDYLFFVESTQHTELSDAASALLERAKELQDK
jgi:hypothetical protein